MDWLDARLQEGLQIVRELLQAEPHAVANLRYQDIPSQCGLYTFTVAGAAAGLYLRAGRTDNLARRIYSEHMSGNQAGNLPMQLVRHERCASLADAKRWIRAYSEVRWVEVLDPLLCMWAEPIMVGLLRPEFADRHQSLLTSVN